MDGINEGLFLFEKEAKYIEELYPKLKYFKEDYTLQYIYGSIELVDDNKNIIDEYFIKIIPTENYPKRFPLVYETNNRLPKNMDWHVHSDGRCCIKAVSEEIHICNNQQITLSSFIEDEVVPYFYGQKFRELNGYFLKERSHGQAGNIEFLSELFQTTNILTMYKFITALIKKREPDRVSICFCQSGKKYRKCHRKIFRSLSYLSEDELNAYKKMIKMYFV